MLTILSPFSDIKLRMICMKDYGGSQYQIPFCFLKLYLWVVCFFKHSMKNHKLVLSTDERIDLLLFLQNSWYFFVYYALLNLCLQNRYILLSAWCLSLQLIHLKEYGQGFSFFVLSLSLTTPYYVSIVF